MTSQASQSRPRVFDTHVHPWRRGWKLDLQHAGVVRALLYANYVPVLPASRNERVLDQVSATRGWTRAVLSYPHDQDVDSWIPRLEALVETGLVAAVKIYLGYSSKFPHDPSFGPVYELASRRNLAVVFHTGDTYRGVGRVRTAHPLELDDVASSYPDLRILLAHFGNPWVLDAAEVVLRHKHVYATTSGMLLPSQDARAQKVTAELLRMGIGYASARKVLFGSDYPVTPIDLALSYLPADLSKTERDMILWRNAERLFRF